MLDPALRKKIPNAITVARLVIAAIFFAMLRFYDHGGAAMAWWLFAAGWVYGLAAATDWIDGHLARKWDASSTFGRVVDPFCDKILVLGSFVFFASRVFSGPGGESLTGVGPIVVIILLGRELLVTTIRSLTADDPGGAMGAKWAGKFKMVFQSIAIPVVLVYVIARGLFPNAVAPGTAWELGLRILRDIAVWGTVLVTVWSAWSYVPKGRRQKDEG